MYIKNKFKSFSAILLIFILAVAFMLVGQGAHAEDKERAVSIPIIMYHSLLYDKSLQNNYTVSPDLFENDLKYLRENGYESVTVKDLVDYVYSDKELKSKSVMLTFDDGYYNNYYYAYPLLKKYNYKAVISPIASMTEKFTKSGEISVTYGNMSISDIKEMVDAGYVEIQNHSYNMHTLKPRRGIEQKSGETLEKYTEVIKEDITKAQNYFKNNADITPTCFVYPFGAKSNSTLEIIKKLGFVCTLTCTEKPNLITKNPDSLYELGRYRREKNETMESLLSRINKDLQKQKR